MSRLGVISDELDDDLEVALGICRDLGLSEVEVRTLAGRSWLKVDAQEFTHAIVRIRESGFDIPVLASPIFKCALPGETGRIGGALHGGAPTATLAEHWDLLEHALERAASVGVPLIRVFSCWRITEPATAVDAIVEIVSEALRRAQAYPVELVIENEHDCNVATAAETLTLLDRVPGLRAIWDPGNHVRAGGSPEESVPSGWANRIAHMHLKDVSSAGHWVGLGLGLVPYAQVVEQARAEGYSGGFSLETHCELNGSRVAATAAAVERLRALGVGA